MVLVNLVLRELFFKCFLSLGFAAVGAKSEKLVKKFFKTTFVLLDRAEEEDEDEAYAMRREDEKEEANVDDGDTYAERSEQNCRQRK